MITAEQVQREVKRFEREWDRPLHVFWVHLTEGSRDDFRVQLTTLFQAQPVIVHVLREQAFTNPNMVMQDLGSIIERQKRDIENRDVRDVMVETGHLDFVLVCRSELNTAITSSPITLPAWFPVSPGEETMAGITDLTWKIKIPLSSPELQREKLASLLYELDFALVERFQKILDEREDWAARLRPLLVDESEGTAPWPSPGEVLERARAELDQVTDPRSWRPSITSRSMVPLLSRTASRRSPLQLPKEAKN